LSGCAGGCAITTARSSAAHGMAGILQHAAVSTGEAEGASAGDADYITRDVHRHAQPKKESSRAVVRSEWRPTNGFTSQPRQRNRELIRCAVALA